MELQICCNLAKIPDTLVSSLSAGQPAVMSPFLLLMQLQCTIKTPCILITMLAEQVEGVEQGPYRAVGVALEVIPRTLAQNCGANVIRTLTKLRAKHADSTDCTFGLNGNTGEIVDMKELGVWEPYAVKVGNKTLFFNATCHSKTCLATPGACPSVC